MLTLEYSSRFLSFFSLFFCLWTIVKSPPGVWGGVVWLPKLWGGAWAPFLAALGFIGANLAWISRDYITVLAASGSRCPYVLAAVRREASPPGDGGDPLHWDENGTGKTHCPSRHCR